MKQVYQKLLETCALQLDALEAELLQGQRAKRRLEDAKATGEWLGGSDFQQLIIAEKQIETATREMSDWRTIRGEFIVKLKELMR